MFFTKREVPQASGTIEASSHRWNLADVWLCFVEIPKGVSSLTGVDCRLVAMKTIEMSSIDVEQPIRPSLGLLGFIESAVGLCPITLSLVRESPSDALSAAFSCCVPKSRHRHPSAETTSYPKDDSDIKRPSYRTSDSTLPDEKSQLSSSRTLSSRPQFEIKRPTTQIRCREYTICANDPTNRICWSDAGVMVTKTFEVGSRVGSVFRRC